MPPKRRRGGESKDDTTISSGKGKASSASSPKPSMKILLEQIQLLSTDKLRCSEALQALIDGKCTLEEQPTKKEHPDSYWFILATHGIHRLTNYLSTTTTTSLQHKNETAVVLALLCHDLTVALFADQTKLERCGHAATTASATGTRTVRGIVGRAIVGITIGCTTALHHLITTASHDDKKASSFAFATAHTKHRNDSDGTSLLQRSIWSVLHALEMVVHMSSSSSSSSLSSKNNVHDILANSASIGSSDIRWHMAQMRLYQDAPFRREKGDTHELDVMAACRSVTKVVHFDHPAEMTCLNTLMIHGVSNATAGISPNTATKKSPSKTPSKRLPRSRGAAAVSKEDSVEVSSPISPSSSASPVFEAFQQLKEYFPSSTSIMVEGRVSIRRWASMTFVWLCQGQQKGLEMVKTLLDYHEYWEEILDCSPKKREKVVSKSPNKKISPRGSKAKQLRKTAAASTSANSDIAVGVPGNVALITMAARLIDISSDSGNACGVRAPTGGMDTYAESVLSSETSSSSPVSKRTARSPGGNSNSSTPSSNNNTRPDIRHLATVVLYRLLHTHAACIEHNTNNILTNNAGGSPVEYLLLNEDPRPNTQPIRNEDASNVGRSLVRVTSSVSSQDVGEDDAGEVFVAQYYPFVHKSVDSLCRAAAASVGNAGRVDSSESLRKLLGLAAAFALGSVSTVPEEQRLEQTSRLRGAKASSTPASTICMVKVDAKLCAFAVNQLAESLRNILNEDESIGGTLSGFSRTNNKDDDGDDEYPQLVEKFSLDKPLPIPELPIDIAETTSVPKSTRRKRTKSDIKNTSLDSFCTFGGVFDVPAKSSPEENAEESKASQISDEMLLSLFLRAMPISPTTLTDKNPGELLLSKLFSVVRCCYVMQQEESVSSPTPKSSSPLARPGSRKRGATVSGGKKKRQKTKKGEERKQEESALSSSSSSSSKRPMNSVRAGLATDVMNALRMCLIHPPVHAASSSSIHRLRLSLRKALCTTHICDFVKLGNMLNNIFIKTRQSKEAAPVTVASSFFANASNSDFTHFEKCLWTAHINLCLTLGRGQTSYDPRKQTSVSEPIMGDAERRLAVFRSIVEAEKRGDRAEMSWPLSLPNVHHALVASNLTGEPFPSNDEEAAPERFVCHSYIASIEFALQNLAIIGKGKRDPSSYQETNKASFDSDDENSSDDIPLSLRDSRLFVLAMSRLPLSEQLICLPKLIGIAADGFSAVKSNEDVYSLVVSNSDVSFFLARLITVCTTIMNIISVGPSLREALFLQVGPTQYQLPSRKNIDMESVEGDNSWYRRERCFMGLFSDWESPTIPDVSMAPDSLNGFPEAVTAQITFLLETALGVGFSSAKNDKCHLLYASWNALGKRSSWEKPDLRTITTSAELSFGKETLPRLLAELRDDICQVYRAIYGSSRAVTDSLLSRMLQSQEMKQRANRPKVEHSLRAMLSKAESIVDALLEESASDPSPSDIPLEVFALMEMLTTYIAFIVSEHTKCDEDFFSPKPRQSKSKKRGGISTDSLEDDGDLLARARAELNSDDSDDSDGEYNEFLDSVDDDARIDAISRLHEACGVYGAAPCHPDWLDNGARLRDGISPEDAAKVAETALNCVTKLGELAFKRHMQSLHRTLALYGKTDEVDDQRVTLALQLFVAVREDEGNDVSSVLHDESDAVLDDWMQNISSLCQITGEGLDLLSENDCNNLVSAREAWCPNSAQKILGKLQDRSITIEGWGATRAELRAAGEWELLVSETLLGSCLEFDNSKVSMGDSKKQTRSTRQEKGHGVFVHAQRWRLVYESAISNLMPCSALLRFALSEGSGRNVHPFNKREPIVHKRLSFNEPLPVDGHRMSEETKSRVSSCLSFLSLAGSAYLPNSIVNRSCHAVATNLLVDSRSFVDLEGMQIIVTAFSGLMTLMELNSSRLLDAEEVVACQSATDKLLVSIENEANAADDGALLKKRLEHGPFSCGPTSLKFAKLLALLGFEAPLAIDSIVPMDFKSAVAGFQLKVLRPEWKCESSEYKAVSSLMSLLFFADMEVSEESRCRLARMIAGATELEFGLISLSGSLSKYSIFLPSITYCCNSFDQDKLKMIIRDDIIVSSTSSIMKLEASKNLCAIFSLLLAPSDGSGRISVLREFEKGAQFFQALFECDEIYASKHVVDLLFLLGSRLDTLKDIGSNLMKTCIDKSLEDSEQSLAALERFFLFVREMDDTLQKVSDSPASSDSWCAILPKTSGNKDPPMIDEGSKDAACTYVLRNGQFHEQHWYNCYSCGLLWDKGCCSLCARVCHKGHEVAYSRFSSFFCDCGAESANAEEQNRSPCKCLTPVSSRDLATTYSDGNPEHFYRNLQTGKPSGEIADEATSLSSIDHKITQIGALAFPTAATTSIDSIKIEAKRASWIASLFKLIHRHFEAWGGTDFMALVLRQKYTDPKSNGIEAYSLMRNALRSSLGTRKGKPLRLELLLEKAMVPARAARANSFKLQLSPDATTDRLKRAMLAKNEIQRVALVSDSRGRLIVAEPGSLLFCSGIPAVNTRYVPNASEKPLSRAQMCLLGSSTLKFNIVGMQLCQSNERHLVVWGSSEACVAVLSTQCDRVEKTIELVFDLEPHECETDYLLKCQWLPGSETIVAVACGPFVKLFDVKRTEKEGRSHESICYSLAYEAMLRDIAFVSSSNADCMPVDRNRQLHRRGTKHNLVRMYLLLDSGCVNMIDLELNNKGELKEKGEKYLEPGEGVSLPTSGVRVFGTSPGTSDSTSRSFGEASSLTYLSQSRILLYKCVSSCVLALLLDSEGKVCGSFEMLPHSVSSELLGTGSDGYDIKGPYTHWTELGVSGDSSSPFFRAACVGKSSKTNQPKLLCVEYNESSVRVKELIWASGASMGLGLSLSSSFDGMAAFSVPVVVNRGSGEESQLYQERAYLVAVTSKGCMLVYGEALSSTNKSQGKEARSASLRRPVFSDSAISRASEDDGKDDRSREKPSFPLTIFETLVNASDFENLTFGGDGVGSDSSRRNKPSGSSVFVMSPSTGGCTITVHLGRSEKGQDESSGNKRKQESSKETENSRDKLVIVAMRVLVGSTSTDFIPKQIFIEGRPVDLKPGAKRWYDLPLTREEVVLGVRNGFVSIAIGPSFDEGNNPLIDAVEVYTLKREDLGWLPEALSSRLCSASKKCMSLGYESGFEHNFLSRQNQLVSSMQATTHICQTLGVGEHVADARATLQQLIQATAIDTAKKGSIRECTIGLLKQVIDPSAIQVFLDEGTLFGVARALVNADRIFEEDPGDSDLMAIDKPQSKENLSPGSAATWAQIRKIIEEGLASATRIARAHPENYARSNEKIVAEGVSSASISVVVNTLLQKALECSLDCTSLVCGVVDLALLELAITSSSDDIDKQHFAGFDAISQLLRSSNSGVVEDCCSAISSFVKSAASPQDSEDQCQPPSTATDKNDQTAPIAYQCDSCSLFPITDSRYTLLEGDHDIDLCKQCYRVGRGYAELQDYDPNVDVMIRGKTLRLDGNTQLSCQQIKQMQPVPIANAIVEQVEQARRAVQTSDSQAPSNLPQAMAEDSEAETLQKALWMSLGENADEIENRQQDVPDERAKHEDFISSLFCDILSAVLTSDGTNSNMTHPVPLFKVLLGVVFNSEREEQQISRAKQLAEHLTRQISHYAQSYEGSKKETSSRESGVYMHLCLKSLTNLLLRNEDIMGETHSDRSTNDVARGPNPPLDSEGNQTAKTKEKTDPRFVCDVHGVPAVRRRCSNGVHKNRRFYVCGLKRNLRCRYFKWADADAKTVEQAPRVEKSLPKTNYCKELEPYLWQLFMECGEDRISPLQSQLCNMLEKNYLAFETSSESKECLPSEVKSSNGKGELEPLGRDQGLILQSMYAFDSSLTDLNDGVLCSKEKLGNTDGQTFLKDKPRRSASATIEDCISTTTEKSLIEASLELLSFIGSSSLQSENESESLSSWYPVLCEIISSSTVVKFRVLAKSVLKRLCGGRKAYHSVRDHYVFGFQFRNLLINSRGPLAAALIVKEQARQCGNDWRRGQEFCWENLRAGDLLGTQELIAEDALTVECRVKISAVLDELMSVTRNRGGNWRQFCGLSNLPRSHRKPTSKNTGTEENSRSSDELLASFDVPPIISLMWIACSLSGADQVKAFELMDVALNASEIATPSNGDEDQDLADDSGVVSSDEGTDIESPNSKAHFFSVGKVLPVDSPEDALLGGKRSLNAYQVNAFIIQFVLRGQTSDLRKVTSGVARSLCQKLAGKDLNNIFMRLLGAPFKEIGMLGRDCVEFLDLLHAIVRNCDLSESFQLANAAQIVVGCFTSQMRVAQQSGDGVLLDTVEEGEISQKFLDFSFCAHCHRKISAGPSSNAPQERSSQGSSENNRTNRFRAVERSQRAAPERETPSQRPWLPDQVRPFVRGPLDEIAESSVSSEFATYVKLKFRLAVSEVHLIVNDPRGRFVKTIAVYFTPRQVNDGSTLKSEQYASMWQRCGTLTLPRGGAQITCNLSTPVIAANLKFEYLDFYERPGGSRSADGGLILHCPRCTRVVNHAHGVCGHCGEVAFQCRKCRHINYDRLDAFLCVECGYCSSGSFSYELTAGIASNAVAIVDEDGYSRAVKVLRVATKLHEDLKVAVTETGRALVSRKRARSGDDFSAVDELSLHGPHLKRAFLGKLPRPGGGRGDGAAGGNSAIHSFRGSAIASIARRGEPSGRTPTSKARSLLRLARQMRRDPGGANRAQGRDFLVRQAFLGSGRRDWSSDNIDDANGEMLGILDSSGGMEMLTVDSSDPLSRLVASIQARVRDSSGRDGEGSDDDEEGGDSGGGGGGGRGQAAEKSDSSPKAVFEECDRLYQLMREAERECFELQRRINAWKHLEHDTLAAVGSLRPTGSPFLPSQCSVCGGSAVLHLLLLAMEIVRVGMKEADAAITKDFVRALFVEPVDMESELLDLKRLALATLATKSERGSKLVLAELRARLHATRDVASAEILGKILQIDFDNVDEYVNLAMETMEHI